MATRALIILPTGTYRAEDYLTAARRLGVSVVVASEEPQVLAETMGDRAIQLPLADPERAAEMIVEHDRRYPFDAVIAVDDEGAVAAALASQALGLRHSPPGAVRLTRDKAAMRRAFERAEVAQPRFAVVEGGSRDAVRRAAAAIGGPVVVKPCSLSGSRGVIRADAPDEAASAAERISRILVEAGEDAGAPLLVEAFVPGPEVAVEGICSNGVLETITIFDKPDPLDGPYFEETLYLAPSSLPSAEQAEVTGATARAVSALGLTDGPVHAELRLGGSHGPVVLEVAARTIGGRCSKALALEGGGSLEELVIARAIGIDGPRARLAGPAGVLMIPIPRSGTLEAVGHVEEVRALEHVTGVEITIPLGRQIRALPEGDRYLGFVFAAADDRGEVEAALRRAGDLLDVTVTG